MRVRFAWLLVIAFPLSGAAAPQQDEKTKVKIKVTDWPEKFKGDESFSATFRVTVDGNPRKWMYADVMARSTLVDIGYGDDESLYVPTEGSGTLTPGMPTSGEWWEKLQFESSQAYLFQLEKTGKMRFLQNDEPQNDTTKYSLDDFDRIELIVKARTPDGAKDEDVRRSKRGKK